MQVSILGPGPQPPDEAVIRRHRMADSVDLPGRLDHTGWWRPIAAAMSTSLRRRWSRSASPPSKPQRRAADRSRSDTGIRESSSTTSRACWPTATRGWWRRSRNGGRSGSAATNLGLRPRHPPVQDWDHVVAVADRSTPGRPGSSAAWLHEPRRAGAPPATRGLRHGRVGRPDSAHPTFSSHPVARRLDAPRRWRRPRRGPARHGGAETYEETGQHLREPVLVDVESTTSRGSRRTASSRTSTQCGCLPRHHRRAGRAGGPQRGRHDIGRPLGPARRGRRPRPGPAGPDGGRRCAPNADPTYGREMTSSTTRASPQSASRRRAAASSAGRATGSPPDHGRQRQCPGRGAGRAGSLAGRARPLPARRVLRLPVGPPADHRAPAARAGGRDLVGRRRPDPGRTRLAGSGWTRGTATRCWHRVPQ